MSSVRYRTNKVCIVDYIELTGNAEQHHWLYLDVSLGICPASRKECGIFLSFLRVPVDTSLGREEYSIMNTRMDTVEHNVADLKLTVRAIEQRLDDVLSTLATKADLEKLRSDMPKWFIAGWVTMFFSLASLQITLFYLAKP